MLLVLPVLIPLVAAALSLVLPARAGLRRALALLATLALTAVGALLLSQVREEGIVALQLAGWRAPLGITFVADLLSALLVLITGVMGFSVVVYSAGMLPRRVEGGAYYPMVLVLLTGVSGSFLTGDLFNLFVWFEVMLVASFVLLALEAGREQLEASIKYMTMSLLASGLFLTGLALLYGAAGTLNMADLASRLPDNAQPGLVTASALVLLVVFGLKAGAFPLFFWLPASYHTPSAPVTTLFSALLTKVGVYALYRTYTLVFVGDVGLTHRVLLWMAVLTMITGVLGAVTQSDLRRLLSFHIVSQIGYLLVGLGLFGRAALAAGIAYWVHYVFAKSALFFVSGAMERVTGSKDLGRMGGLSRTHPLLAGLFLIPALSLAGIPPFSGFFAKMALLRAAVREEAWWVVAAAAAVGLLTLYSMMKVWREAFWKEAPAGAETEWTRRGSGPAALLAPCVALAALMVGLGVFAAPLLAISGAAADQLLDPAGYIRAVLGEVSR